VIAPPRPGREVDFFLAAHALGRFLVNGWGAYEDATTVEAAERAVTQGNDPAFEQRAESQSSAEQQAGGSGRFRLTPSEFLLKLLQLRLAVRELFELSVPQSWPSLTRDLIVLSAVNHRTLLRQMLRAVLAAELPKPLAALGGDRVADALAVEGMVRQAFFIFAPGRVQAASKAWLRGVVDRETILRSPMAWEDASTQPAEDVPQWSDWSSPGRMTRVLAAAEERTGVYRQEPGSLVTPGRFVMMWRSIIAATDLAVRWTERMQVVDLIKASRRDMAETQEALARTRADVAERALRLADEAAELRRRAQQLAAAGGRGSSGAAGAAGQGGAAAGAAAQGRKKKGKGRR
jgi:hypothetical protein